MRAEQGFCKTAPVRQFAGPAAKSSNNNKSVESKLGVMFVPGQLKSVVDVHTKKEISCRADEMVGTK